MIKKAFLGAVLISLVLSFAVEADEVGKSCKLYVNDWRGNKILSMTFTYLDDYVLSEDEFNKKISEEAANHLKDYQVFHIKVEGHWEDVDYWESYFDTRDIYIVQKKKQYKPEVKSIKSGDIIRGAEKEGLLLFDEKLDMTESMKIYYTHYEAVKKTFKIDRGYFQERERWRRMRKARGE